MIRTPIIIFLAFFLIGVGYCVENIDIVESDQHGVVLQIKPFSLNFSVVEINGERFQKIAPVNGAYFTNEPGFPQLPFISVVVAIPFSSSPEVRLLEAGFEEIGDISLCPAPDVRLERNEFGETFKEVFVLNDEVYNSDQFYPLSPVEISPPQIIRDHRVVTLRLYPVQFNPIKKTLRKYNRLSVRLVYHAEEKKQPGIRPRLKNDPFEKIYQNVLLNYPAAKNWKRTQERESVLLKVPQQEWYDPAYPYYKLSVKEDGLYRLSFSDLSRYGISVTGVDPRTVKLYCSGKEVPLRVAGEADGSFDEADFIEFYGERKYGGSSYYDDYSDTNIYWLTFGGAYGERFVEKSSLSGQYDEMTTFREYKHIEKDLTFYHGDEGRTIINTELVPGEGWVWKIFYKDEKQDFPVYLEHADKASSQLCTLKVRLRGTTLDSVDPDHLAQFSFNNSLIGEASFDNREEIVYSLNFPSALLKNGRNTFTIKSVDTGAKINSFYFDWLELSYPATFLAVKDRVKFKPEEERIGRLSLWNFSSDTVSIYNLTKGYVISDFQVKNEQRFIIMLLSAGFDDGNFAQIQINNENIIYGGRRGHNIAVYDTSTATPEDTRWFDTLDKSENADSMAAYISQIPEGKLVLVAIRDEGSNRMTEAAHQALESVGSTLTRQVGFRDSYVLLGRKGAAPGTVPELLVPAGQGKAVLVDTLYTFHKDKKHLTFQDHFVAGDEFIISTVDSMLKPAKVTADQYQNLKSQTNGADYIFITHKNFLLTAEKFAAFWAERNYRTMVTDIEDIYDEFNYGIKHARAIKNFLTYAYQHWQQPAPTFVMLIGDASRDPKKNAPTSVKEDYIPTYGNPVTDTYFVCFDGEDDLLPDMFIGRLAIETNEEGERIFGKTERYAALPSADWKKHILFINGGFNDTEQMIFGGQSENLINSYVQVPPASCVPHVISKELDGLYEGEKREEIIEAINNGKLWVNFIGHGGSGTWELMFHDAQILQLNNSERLPFVTSLTCHTGRFANPEITNFGENFVNYSDAGAIGFMGSSGWGFVYEDEQFANTLFETVLKDTVHQLGAAITMAKIKFWGMMAPTVRTKSIIYQYSLLGDPAIDLTLPEQPDLTLSEKDVNWSPFSPVEQDSLVHIKLNMFNYGLATPDSFFLRVKDDYQSTGAFDVLHEKIPPMGYADSVKINLNISNKAGEHVLEYIIDANNDIEEADETNNQISSSIIVGSSRITISMPGKNQLVTETTPRLQINNPIAEQRATGYYFELDTIDTFDSDRLTQSGLIPEGEIVTFWMPPELAKHQLYYWRCRRVADDPVAYWITSHFTIGEEFGWEQRRALQFKDNKFIRAELTPSGVQLQHTEVIFRVESSGWDDLNYAVIFVNHTPVATATRGHNIAVCDEYGTFLEFRKFDTHNSPEEVAAMVTFLNNVPPGYYVLAGIRDSGEQAMTESAYQALESIGSQYCRNVGFRDAWAIIGKKGAPIGSVPEQWVKRFQGVAIVEDTLITYRASGEVVTPEIGPANGWKQLSYTADTPSSETNVSVDVIGFHRGTASWDTLLQNLSLPDGVNLAAIDHQVYPKIKLKAKLSSSDKLTTPRLQDWKVTFNPVSDMAIAEETVKFSADTVIVGTILTIKAEIHNVGYADEDSVSVRFYGKNAQREKHLLEEIIINELPANGQKSVTVAWNSKERIGTNQLDIEIDPDDQINELNENNNFFSKQIVVLPDTIEPELVVTFDGRQIVSGDYVSSRPNIFIKVYDNNPAPIKNDTSRVHLLLDGTRVHYYGNEHVISMVVPEVSADSAVKAEVRFTPSLEDGEHVLEIFVKDAGDNTTYQRNDFKVVSDLKLLNVFNYPNPFSENTSFTFHLTQPAERVTIKIYTTAGRLLHRLEQYHCEAGFQQVFWDGRDRDGDILANGVYLYKIIARAGNNQVEKIEKLVMMR